MSGYEENSKKYVYKNIYSFIPFTQVLFNLFLSRKLYFCSTAVYRKDLYITIFHYITNIKYNKKQWDDLFIGYTVL
jgi:hypothetical protein